MKSMCCDHDQDANFVDAAPQHRLQVRVGRRDCPSPHSWRNKVGRVLWSMACAALFRPSPRICFGWRRLLLKCFGARIGANARIHPTVRIWAPWNLTIGTEASVAHSVDCYCVGPLEIGAHATVSQYAMLCTATHDVSDPNMGLITSPVVISDQAWVCARAFVAPGVVIGEGAVVGAQSVVTRNVAPWTIVAGNPARMINRRILTPTVTKQ
jgi:putative colanic acid biosynthesis acetyltransferase WcaF